MPIKCNRLERQRPAFFKMSPFWTTKGRTVNDEPSSELFCQAHEKNQFATQLKSY